MQSFPLVSVIMPAYNASSTIQESINSVLAQDYEDWELIIVDNGSTDHTNEIVKNYKYNNIRYYWQEGSGSPANPRNNGIKKSKGEYIAFLDSDDLWEKNKLSEQIECFKKANYDFGLVHTGYMEFDATSVFRPKPLKHTKLNKFSGKVTDALILHNFIATLTVMVKREAVENCGYFDETLSGTEDWDLWIRISKLYEVGYLRESLAKYRVSQSSYSKNYHKFEEESYKVLDRYLLNGEYSDKEKKHGLWLHNRHMTHGFTRSNQFVIAYQRLKIAVKLKPLKAANFLTFCYLCIYLIKYCLKHISPFGLIEKGFNNK